LLRVINFMRHRKLYFLISALVLVPGIISLLLFGLKPSIDFTGGTLWEVRVEISDQASDISGILEGIFTEQGLEVASVQPSGNSQFIVRTSPLSIEQHDQTLVGLEERLGEIEEIRFETLGPTLGRELLNKAFLAIGLAALAILGYVAYRFRDLMYGVTAILAMFHDTFVLLGIFSLLGHFFGVEVGTLFVTAVLTTLTFSVHDTIVVFDRVREILRRTSLDLENAVNQAVGETLVRSINNSLTIVFMLLALLFLGGESLRWFIFALLAGTISGTYSSTFTAAPLLVAWDKLMSKRR
jgi:preprotein translocase subunit SecF